MSSVCKKRRLVVNKDSTVALIIVFGRQAHCFSFLCTYMDSYYFQVSFHTWIYKSFYYIKWSLFAVILAICK